MNRTIKLLFAFTLPALMLACGGNGNEQKEEIIQEEAQTEDCLYTYNEEASSIKWTAFKTTDRVGVDGGFDSVLVMLPDSNWSVLEALKNASFTIYTESVVTNNPDRDKTIRTYFFDNLKDNGKIDGAIKIVEGDEQSGGGTVKLKLNGVTRDMGFKYVVENDVITISTKINLNSFEGEDAVKALNDYCGVLHSGADGVSKLWPDIEIEVKAVLNKEC